MLDILTSWCPLQCLQQWWSSPGKLKFSKGADRQMIRVVLYKHHHLRFKQHQQKHAGMYQFRWRYPAATSTVHVPAGRWTISQKSPQFDSSALCPSLVPINFLFTSLWSLRTIKKKLTQPMCFIKNDTPGRAFLSFCNDFNDGPGSHIQDFLLSKPRPENEAHSWVINQETNFSKGVLSWWVESSKVSCYNIVSNKTGNAVFFKSTLIGTAGLWHTKLAGFLFLIIDARALLHGYGWWAPPTWKIKWQRWAEKETHPSWL